MLTSWSFVRSRSEDSCKELSAQSSLGNPQAVPQWGAKALLGGNKLSLSLCSSRYDEHLVLVERPFRLRFGVGFFMDFFFMQGLKDAQGIQGS